MKRQTLTRIALALAAGAAVGVFFVLTAPEPCERAEGRLLLALRAEAWPRVVKRADRLAACRPADPFAPYARANALARLGEAEDALTSLRLALALGHDDPAWLQTEEAFAPYREDLRFLGLAEEMQQARRKRLETLYRPGPALSGVRVLEGRPEEGLWWRLYLPPQPGDERLPLLIWMHPAGGSENLRIEPMAPRLLEAGWALLVPTAKDFGGWTGHDTRRLFAHSLAAAGAHPEVDTRRPIVFGYSAGGQKALDLWLEGTYPLGGLVLMAAYPVDSLALLEGRWEVPAPPPGEAGRLPLFALVGGDDPGAAWWSKVAAAWQSRPGSLEIHRVPGQGHTWVLDEEREAALLRWLEHRAGERRAQQPGQRPVPDPFAPKTAGL
ncbi:MAG: hypothetical protein P1V51_18990 [Deltaproteobacteria bacterium]|nr:hypothetical protein [Deltaproteobacteria bacterium]